MGRKYFLCVLLSLLLVGCASNQTTVSSRYTKHENNHSPKREREKLTVLASSFTQESRRNYPDWVGQMEQEGYGNSIWQELEDILYESGHFELLMEPPTSSEEFRQVLSARKGGGIAGNNLRVEMPDLLLSTNVNFFKKTKQTLHGMNVVEREEFHATVHLRYYDLNSGVANRSIPATGDAVSDDLLKATRIASRRAAEKLLRRIGRI